MSPLVRLFVTLTVMAATAGGIEVYARHTTQAPIDEQTLVRAANVIVMSKDPKVLPPRAGDPSLWLLGNSHTYALPGLKRGDAMRSDTGHTLIDELAGQLSERDPAYARARFLRLANPNLLPIEMLVRARWLLDQGYVPDVVVIGVTWRNVARDQELRHDISRLFADEGFVKRLSEGVGTPLATAFDAEVRRVAHEEEIERQRSSADRLDEEVSRRVGSYVTLVGVSADLRATLYRSFAYGLAAVMGSRASELSYDVVPADLRVNEAALEVLVRTLREREVAVAVYLAPERTDLPPLMERGAQEDFTVRLRTMLEAHGAKLIDARKAVPNEFWGWEKSMPDRSHFTEPGHRRLAKALVDEGEALALFQGLKR